MDPNNWLDVFGLNCQEPTTGTPTNQEVNTGANAPEGGGVYSFNDKNGNTYGGSTNDFQSRMNDHVGTGMLPAGNTVEFTPVNTGNRSDKGARRFFEQQKIGFDADGVPLANKSTRTRAVSPQKWKKYAPNGKINFNDKYFD